MSDTDNTLKNNPGSAALDYSTVDIPVRIAVYDNMKSIPRIVNLNFNDINNLINQTAQNT